MIVLLDNGHGVDTPGKCSPAWQDHLRLFEWEFNRDVVKRIMAKCHDARICVVPLVTEDNDVPLAERCRRANMWYDKDDTLLLSIHANAGGGTGFEVFTSVGKTKADEYATALIARLEADFPGIKMRKDYADGDADKESDFYVLKHTKAPALLVENLFMDNEIDCLKLCNNDFRDLLARSYVRFLQDIINH